MHWMKHEAKCGIPGLFSRIASLGLLVGMTAVFAPTGCSSSMEQARVRYHEQHQNRGDLLHDITVERLQGCVEEFGEQLNEEDSVDVGAIVRVYHDGRIQGVTVGGIPDSAPDLAACTRVTLREMAVPPLPLRPNTKDDTANIPAKPVGNEMANPAVMVEVAIILGEFMAQHGGKAVLYSVTIEVLSAAAIAGATTYLRRIRKKCLDHYEKCVDSNLFWKEGKHIKDSRCSLCRDLCENNDGKWPHEVSIGLCQY